MFGGSKPTFGQQSTASAFPSFNTTQQNTGFGQSAFAKPAGGFGASFQQPTSVFGAPQPTPGTSLFGTAQPQQQQQQGFGSKLYNFCKQRKDFHFLMKLHSFRSATTTTTTTNFNFRCNKHNRNNISLRSPANTFFWSCKTCWLWLWTTTTAFNFSVFKQSCSASANITFWTNSNNQHSRWTLWWSSNNWIWATKCTAAIWNSSR